MSSLQAPEDLLRIVQQLRADVLANAEEILAGWRPHILRPQYEASAHNLACYLALRRHDLRALQLALTRYGLSSLGRSESRVQASLDALVTTLSAIRGIEPDARPAYPDEDALFSGTQAIARDAEALFGGARRPRATRIMVTLPSEAAEEPELLRALVLAGVDCVRINCAHDSVDAWSAMLRNLRSAERELGPREKIRVLMDLAGPKVRTLRPKKAHKQRFHVGDRLLLVTEQVLEQVPKHEPRRSALAVVGCTLPEALAQLAVGASVQIDDGRIGARVIERVAEGAVAEVVQAPVEGRRIRADKGINFPDTDFEAASLTDKDRRDLDFVAEHADMVGFSFVQTGRDVGELIDALAQRPSSQRRELGLVLKIETKRAVRNLPDLIVHAAGKGLMAVMIARGDLAVELGFQRMAEMQEEILWLCEAANVPVIWATQVLEGMAKEGLPTRAEVTDAAMASRAECVMLNKGPHIVATIGLLDDVLTRMAGHQYKKTPQLRVLHSWREAFVERDATEPG